MRVLTIVATLFIPLTFIAGIYRMNFRSAITFSVSTRLRLRLSGSMTYNSEPLTEKWHYKYLSMLRVTL